MYLLQVPLFHCNPRGRPRVVLTLNGLKLKGSGPCLNIKQYFPDMGIHMLMIRRSRDRPVFNMGIAIPVRRIYIETAPRLPLHLVRFYSAAPIGMSGWRMYYDNDNDNDTILLNTRNTDTRRGFWYPLSFPYYLNCTARSEYVFLMQLTYEARCTGWY